MQIRVYTFYHIAKTILVSIILVNLFSCSQTKYVPEGKYLQNKIILKLDNKKLKKDELRSQVKQKENLRILGFIKFHLGIYNLSSTHKTDGWLKRIGEAPVLYEEFQAKRSKEQLELYLKNKGYFNSRVTDSIKIDSKNRKLNLYLNIKANNPYRIYDYSYQISDSELEKIVFADTVNQLLKRNFIFDLDILNQERQRISKLAKNNGYYKFSEDFVSFVADTNFMQNRVDLVMIIDGLQLNKSIDSADNHQKYKIRNYYINPSVKTVELIGEEPDVKLDTIKIDDFIISYSGKLVYKPELFIDINRMKDSTYYSLSNAEKTYRAYNRLKQFRLINIGFVETDSFDKDLNPLLDCRIQLSPLPRQNFSVDVEGTNSSGNLGVVGNLNFQHRNVFGGAEVFDVKIKGARERQQALINNSSLDFNTLEFGFESSITVPKFLSFIAKKRMFNFQIPETKLTFGYNYQSRPDYTRTITNFKYGYNWKTTNFDFHTFNIADLNFVNLYDHNPAFINSIQNLYIKSSFTDHLISATNYSWLYNTQNINKRESYKYFRFSFESAGNLLSVLSKSINKNKTLFTDSLTNQGGSYYEILNIRFAQYLKSDFEYRLGFVINDFSSLVGRAFVGAGVPYGNFNVLPFEKKYFTGGANGIRAWQVRSLGPGSYKAPIDAYPNQSSDIKLEANIEYRFKLLWIIEGAMFADAGNIWAINYKDNREGAVFKIDTFHKQIAVGTGFGLRFDFSYFIFRLDLGMKLRDPSLLAGKKFIPWNYPISGEHFNLSFAIGYPF